MHINPYRLIAQQTIDAWRTIFFVTIVLYAIEIVVYTMLASGEQQTWNQGVAQSDSKTAFAAEDTPLTAGQSVAAGGDKATSNYTVEATG